MGLADDHKITGVGRVVGHLDAVAFFDRGCLLDAHPDLPADSVAVDDQDGELREVIAGCAVDVLASAWDRLPEASNARSGRVAGPVLNYDI